LTGVVIVKMRADRATPLRALFGWQLVRLTVVLHAGVIALTIPRVAALVSNVRTKASITVSQQASTQKWQSQ
jgi:hypothetical protein